MYRGDAPATWTGNRDERHFRRESSGTGASSLSTNLFHKSFVCLTRQAMHPANAGPGGGIMNAKVNAWTAGLAAAGLVSVPSTALPEEQPTAVLTALSST